MGYKFSNKSIIEAVQAVNGMIYLAARKLGCTPQTIYNRMEKNAQIREAVEMSRGEMIDIAEQKLRMAVSNGEPWSIGLVLKTIGKNRGYVERQEVTGADGGAIIVEWDDSENND